MAPACRSGGSMEAKTRVSNIRMVDGKLWVEIEVISHSFCESDKPPTIKARG